MRDETLSLSLSSVSSDCLSVVLCYEVIYDFYHLIAGKAKNKIHINMAPPPPFSLENIIITICCIIGIYIYVLLSLVYIYIGEFAADTVCFLYNINQRFFSTVASVFALRIKSVGQVQWRKKFEQKWTIDDC